MRSHCDSKCVTLICHKANVTLICFILNGAFFMYYISHGIMFGTLKKKEMAVEFLF